MILCTPPITLLGDLGEAELLYETLRHKPLADVRAAIRAGQYSSHTAGLGRGFLQANLAIMAEAYSDVAPAYASVLQSFFAQSNN